MRERERERVFVSSTKHTQCGGADNIETKTSTLGIPF